MLFITTQEGDKREVISQSQLETLIARLEGKTHVLHSDTAEIASVLAKLHRLVVRS